MKKEHVVLIFVLFILTAIVAVTKDSEFFWSVFQITATL